MSFNQISAVIARERSVFKDAKKLLPYVHRGEAALFTRLVALMGLNALSKIMRSSWTYSLAADASAQILGTAYFAIMLRIPPMRLEDDIVALHLVAPPLRGSHTGEVMFDMTAKVLGALNPDWHSKLMGSTSDGAGNMVGVDLGWQTRLEEAFMESGETVFFKWHCGPHQCNLVNGKAVKVLETTGSGWMAKLYDIITYTRKEANLIEDMGSQSPYHINVRWVSFEIVMAWYRRHMDRLEAHYVEKEKEIAEDTCWWIVMILLHEHFKILGITFKSLQNSADFVSI